MNYYEHHLGDYDSATAHLSWLEDCAYRRLISLYYRTEQPIPADMKQAWRLLRATTKPERDAVEQVLREFFELTDDGWRNPRCDEDLGRYLETEPDRQARRDNDRERQRRSRERRRNLFEQLRAHGKVPAFETKTSELEAMLSRVTSQPVTDVTPTPVTCDNTATQTPVTSHQTPDTSHHPYVLDGGAAPSAPPAPPPFDGQNAQELNGKAVVALAPNFELPEGWGVDAEALGFTVTTVLREAERFRQYWVSGRGAGTRRSVKGWRQSWSNWLEKAAKDAR